MNNDCIEWVIYKLFNILIPKNDQYNSKFFFQNQHFKFYYNFNQNL